MDREKVIKGLEECMTASCRGYKPRLLCPYNDEEWNIMRDALALLKEQEAIKPYAQGDGSYACNNCGETVGWEEMNCGGISLVKYKFCPECGRAVKWDG